MHLNFKKIGQGHPLIIMHGLYGSGENWLTIGKKLADYFTVYLIDLRNHGNSPHDPELNYLVLSQDIEDFCSQNNITKASVLGHSMGGKTAMSLAYRNPGLISNLIIVDIAPKSYNGTGSSQPARIEHANIIKALLNSKISVADDRHEIGKLLQEYIDDERIRRFLMKNILKNNGNFQWRINVKAIAENINLIFDWPYSEEQIRSGKQNFPVLFIKGEKSDYIQDSDYKTIQELYPFSKIKVINNTGHWLHAEKPEEFLKLILEFIF